ncbi:bifunctional diguanylate cyclase/phosphodiesterase [Amphritea opalescens]|uniref:Bifunctional diguanylate cyclase/phosphodiesterase n=2 Tax=Amphritea opalescens TaxID=2490544 RepID=A0A430KV12_9GAMM|nr:bifunctional diguanylate cyclase/phosphodiesterase [Amphritea opalescens]
MTFKTTNKVYLAVLIYIVWVVLYVVWDYSHEHERIYQQIDNDLISSAVATPLILPKHFHHKGMQPGDVMPEEDLDNTLKLSRFVRSSNIIYVYTLIKEDDTIFFTSSSSTVTELQAGKNLYNYFLPYDDADPRINLVFADQKQRFLEITDAWGHFRSVFIPRTSPDGLQYITAADIEISQIQTQLNQRLIQQIGVTVIFLLFLLPILWTFSSAQRRWAKDLEASVRERTEELHSSKAFLSSIIEHSPVGFFHYDQHGTISMINQRFTDIIGAPSDSIVGINLLEKLTNEDVIDALNESLQGDVGYFEGPYVSIMGHRSMHLIAEFVPLRDKMGVLNGGVGVFNDVTEQQATTDTLKKLSRAVEQSPSAVVITDLNGNIEYVNPRFTDITGYTADEVMGKTSRLLNSGETSKEVYHDLWKTLLSGQEWRGVFHNKKKSGELYWTEEIISPITNNLGQITHFVALQEDVTEARRISDEIDFQTTHDPLTGLLNRQQFENELAQTIEHAHQHHSHHVLCFIDIDQFKIINDTCGHMAGDDMLRQLSNLIRDKLRSHDIFARPGGDEFLLLLKNASLARAEHIIQVIMTDLKQFRFQWEDHNFTVEISAGLTIIDQNTDSAVGALQDVDTACYTAKDAGRNRIHIYNDQDEQQLIRKGYIQWASEIHRALDENAFRLYAQPIVPLQKEQKIGYEILLRLLSEQGEIIAPDAFLPAAERYNIAPQIDRWVIRNSLQWMAKNIDNLEHISSLAINLSGQSLGDDALLGFIIRSIQQGPVPAHMIKFEITETAAIANLKNAQIFIRSLKNLGCRFALDDFGSGLSSFAYLKNLPVDLLKIDGMFVRNILIDPIDEAMVRSINEVGHIMGMETIAEFVETDAMMERLKTMGVDYAQGYAISRPVPIDTILESTALTTV